MHVRFVNDTSHSVLNVCGVVLEREKSLKSVMKR